MTLLDGSSGSAANKARDTIRKVATALAGQPLTWVAVDVSRQSSFRRAYGFETEQLPALVALSTKRMRFAQVRLETTSMDEQRFEGFLEKLRPAMVAGASSRHVLAGILLHCA
jgi:hypothetical protein